MRLACLLLIIWAVLLPLGLSAQAPPKIPLGNLAYQANFLQEWQADQDSDQILAWQPTRQGLVLGNTDPEAPARYANGTRFITQNFYLEVTFIPITCADPASAFLLNTRSDSSQATPLTATAYVFVVECSGAIRSRVVNEGGASGLIDFTGQLNTPLNPKTPIHMGIMLNGRDALWLIDGVEVGRYSVSQLARPGQFAFGTQRGLEAILTDFKVWHLDNPK